LLGKKGYVVVVVVVVVVVNFIVSEHALFMQQNRIEPRRYYELFEKDTIKFGNSRYDQNH